MTSRVFNTLSMALAITATMGWPSAQASTWTGASSTWSSNANPGWNGTGIPNGIGATADISGISKTVTQDISGVTIGTMTVGGTTNAQVNVTLTNAIIFNQDGGGSGFATVSNTASGTGGRIALSSGTLTMADDLLITNTGASTSASGSITFSGILAGTGNLTLNNVSNNINAGALSLSGSASTFTGNVLIQKGAVLANSLGNSANTVALGSSGNGAASLITTGSTSSITNNITVVSGTGGTLLIGSNSTATSNSIFSGSLALNDNVTLTSSKTGAGDTRYTGVISGSGSVTLAGTGETQFGNGSTSLTNTFTGDTTLSETASFALSDNAKMTFVIGASGVNNKITGTGQTALLDGDFTFDLTGAASTGSWTIVDNANLAETFSSTFTVVGFTEVSNVWTSGNYSFSEATGVLTAVPEPSTWALLGGGMILLAGLRASRCRTS